MNEISKLDAKQQPVVRVRNLSKNYGSHMALTDVNFDVMPGEIVGLLGLNGAGKSTILKVLGAMLTPTSGKIDVGGYSVEDNPYEVRQLLGYLPDQPPLYDEMTVRQYLRFVAGIKGFDKKGMDKKEIQTAVEDAMVKTNLDRVADVVLGALSHGYRQRAGIAQAIVHKPKIVILDEPINGLDPLQIVEMRDLINSLRNSHTVILSSHILSEITRTCDRILIIDQGRVTAQGSEAELRTRIQEQQTVKVELAKSDESAITKVARMLESMTGIASVKIDGRFLNVHTNEDMRPAIAKAIVETGHGLAGLTRHDDGLENLFVKLIKQDGQIDGDAATPDSRSYRGDFNEHA